MLHSFDGSLTEVQRQFATIRTLPGQFGPDLFVPRPEVSSWSAGEHLDHVIKVAQAFLGQMRKDEPLDVPGVNWTGRVILGIGWIPRGKGKAPERVRGAVCTAEDLEAMLAAAEGLLLEVRAAPPKERRRPLAKHPVFRGLNAAESARMVAVHTHHHLKIVRDIARAGGRRLAV